MKYFLLAGEASGDLHGSNLVRELKKSDPEAEIVCWGGDLMEQEGARLLMHYRELAFMGALEVLRNLGKIRVNLKKCQSDILAFKPDLVILIDYPGFNLRIAKFLKGKLSRVYYFISPKIWAWKKSRIKKIKAYISRMYVIFPFEKEFYRQLGYEVKYFGNPLVDTVTARLAAAAPEKDFLSENGLDKKPLVALLAGSRVQEIKHMLPEMIKLTEYYLDYQFVIAGVRSVPAGLYSKICGDSGIKVIYDSTYVLLRYCSAAIVTSGTATLETAIAGVPQVVCYKTSWLTYTLAKAFIRVRFISLVNLIMDREVVKELIQDSMKAQDIAAELNIILPGGWKRDVIKKEYHDLSHILEGKDAARRIVTDMYNSLILVRNVN